VLSSLRQGYYVYVLAFSCCDTIPKKSNFRKERFILVHGFRCFNPLSLGSIVSRPVAVEYHDGKDMAEQVCSPHGNQEAEREHKEGTRGKIHPCRAWPQ
jgi:hypothetical protein